MLIFMKIQENVGGRDRVAIEATLFSKGNQINYIWLLIDTAASKWIALAINSQDQMDEQVD